MKEICIPIAEFEELDIAEIDLKIGGKKVRYHFRIESFPWDVDDDLSVQQDDISKSLARITRLKTAIENYDTNWDLIQIYKPAVNAKVIHVLYRKKQPRS